MGGMTVLYFTSGAASSRSPMFLFFPVMMLVSVLGSVAYQSRGARRGGELDGDRRAYLRYLDELDEALARTAEAQHESLHWSHPDPEALWTLVGGARMWERRPGDDDFCHVRVGIGTRPLSTALVRAGTSARSKSRDPVVDDADRPAARRSVDGAGPARHRGPARASAHRRRGSARRGAGVGAGDGLPAGRPARSGRREGDRRRRFRGSALGLAEMASASWRSTAGPVPIAIVDVVILDGGEAAMVGSPGADATVITIGPPAGDCLRLDVDATAAVDRPDSLTTAAGGRSAPGALAPCARRRRHDGGAADWAELVGIGDPAHLDVGRAWRPRTGPDASGWRSAARTDGDAGGAGPQGGRARRHGPARAVRRRHRIRQVGVPADAGPRSGRHPRSRRAEPGPRRLQGWRNVSRASSGSDTSRPS